MVPTLSASNPAVHSFDTPANRRLAYRAAAEGLVLLLNKKGALPLGWQASAHRPADGTPTLDSSRQRAGDGMHVAVLGSLGCDTQPARDATLWARTHPTTARSPYRRSAPPPRPLAASATSNMSQVRGQMRRRTRRISRRRRRQRSRQTPLWSSRAIRSRRAVSGTTAITSTCLAASWSCSRRVQGREDAVAPAHARQGRPGLTEWSSSRWRGPFLSPS